MRACLVISERGVEKLLSLGEGPEQMREAARLTDWVWPDIVAFHEAIRARTPPAAGPKTRKRPVPSTA